MRILNFGSLNLDHVYRVEHIAAPGETVAAAGYRQFCGGKGLNQSIALARAGATVAHAGRVGRDGGVLEARLAADGVDVSLLARGDGPSGHAVIQVAADGENAIVIHGGANREIDAAAARRALAGFAPGDWLLVQNEISAIPEIIRQAAGRGLRIAFNPAPMTPEVPAYPLDLVDLLIVNETEARALAGPGADVARILRARWPRAALVLTLGSRGARYLAAGADFFAPAPPVDAIDTTAAGDTFIGYFLAALAAGAPPPDALRRACCAAALSTTRPGAADSIPFPHELDA